MLNITHHKRLYLVHFRKNEKWLQETLLLAVSSLCLNKESRTSEELTLSSKSTEERLEHKHLPPSVCFPLAPKHRCARWQTQPGKHTLMFLCPIGPPPVSQRCRQKTCTFSHLIRLFFLRHKAIRLLFCAFLGQCNAAIHAVERKRGVYRLCCYPFPANATAHHFECNMVNLDKQKQNKKYQWFSRMPMQPKEELKSKNWASIYRDAVLLTDVPKNTQEAKGKTHRCVSVTVTEVFGDFPSHLHCIRM